MKLYMEKLHQNWAQANKPKFIDIPIKNQGPQQSNIYPQLQLNAGNI